MQDIVIKTFGLTKKYGAKLAVNNVNMTIYKKDIYGFIGNNGAGKTTLIRMLMGLAHPTAGQIELFGSSEQKHLVRSRARIGAIVETPSLAINMSAKDCLNTQRLLYGVESKVIVDELLEIVGLTGTGKKKIKDFSLGMKQRLSIAQAMLNSPDILLLDEPTNGMDPRGIIEIRKLLHNLRDQRDITILISSHILAELQQIATRYGIIHNGELIDEFTSDELEKKIILGIALKVDDINKAINVLTKNFDEGSFCVFGEDKIRIINSTDFCKVNKLLVSNDISVDVLSKDQLNLEQYFLSRVGG